MWFNPIMIWLLRSPLHGLISGSTMLVTYTGRKSGKTYSTPVNYHGIGGRLYTVSLRERAWWRNLRGGGEVTLLLRGKMAPARGAVVEDAAGVELALVDYIKDMPSAATFLKVRLLPGGAPDAVDVRRAASQRVVASFEPLI
jgi:hypothetical protein